jgi:hypothetical protein
MSKEEVRDESDRPFQISQLQVMLNINGKSKEQVPFNLDMIYSPDLESNPPVTTSKLPFFTRDALFPGFNLTFRSMKERIEFFFNINEFKRIMLQEGSGWVDTSAKPMKEETPVEEDEDEENEKPKNARPAEDADYVPFSDEQIRIEKDNIMTFLRCFFFISDSFGNAIQSTHQHLMKGTWNPEILYGMDVLQSVNFFGFMETFGIIKKDYGFSYIKVDGKPQLIFGTIWENDIVNHPVYKIFLSNYYKQISNGKPLIYKVEKDKRSFLARLKKQLDKSKSTSKEKKEILAKIAAKDYKQIAKDFGISSRIKLDADNLEWNLLNLPETKLLEGLNKSIGTSAGPKDAKILQKKQYLGAMISFLSTNISDQDSRYAARNNVIQNIIGKLDRINETTEIEQAAKELLTIQSLMYEYNEKNRSAPLSLGEFDTEFKSGYLNYAVDFTAAKLALDFLENNVVIRQAKNKVYFDGSEETEADRLVLSRIKYLYESVFAMSTKLGQSLSDVYRPKRITSNPYLYRLIYRTRFGQFQEETDAETQKREEHMFELIYNKYFSRYPPNVRNKTDAPYLYTGVDSVSTSDSPSSDDMERVEIYVRLNVLNKDKFENDQKARCKTTNDSLTNRLRYLLDIPSTSVENPFRDYQLADGISESVYAPKETLRAKGGTRKWNKRSGKRTRSRR